ncbi:unnamed protein product [Rotaria magnacalcarata]
MTFSLPTDTLYLRGDPFYRIVDEFCGSEALELLRFQLIDSSMDLLEINDVFSILQMESDRTVALKELLGVSGKDQVGNYSFFVMPGIRLKIAKFIRLLRSLLPSTNSSSQSTIKTSTISSDLLQQYPFLNDLIYCLESNLLNDLTLDIISNMISNLVHSKNLFRYKQSVKDFAACLYILGGRTVVEFIRLNIPGFIPSLPSLRPMLQSSKYHFIEGVFQYDHLADFIKPFNCKYAFCGEDSTSVVPKVSYDTLSDCFVGFTLPLKHGFPCPRYFSTNSFGELENWYNEVDVSFNINVHIIQGLFSIGQTSPPPFLLGAYGTNSKYTALDVLKRWINIFDLCMAQNLRILGFSTDCDTRYMKAMRDSMGFFSKFETGFENHPDHFEISMLQNTSWFFLKPHQLFVCLQDGVHLCTKLRNRLLAANVVLLMGEQYASVSYLIELIENCSKIDHGLVISDVYPKDKQNFASCVKISSNGVLNVLKKIQNSEATQVYLQIIQFIRFAYVDKSPNIIDRLYYAWCAVFIVRMWSAWIESTRIADLKEKISQLFLADSNSITSKSKLFITIPALFSIELNAHSLTYLAVLVADQQITEEALNISLFNSQMCEATFRAARSMSGPFSSVVNFSIHEFLQRVEKLAVLQRIKCSSDSNENSIVFPKHHKQHRQTFSSLSTSVMTTPITEKLLEDTVFSAFINASEILSKCKLSILDLDGKMISFEEVNQLAFKKLARSTCESSKKKNTESKNENEAAVARTEDEDEDKDKEEQEEEENDDDERRSSKNHAVDESDDSISINEFDLDILPDVSSSTIHGMRIFDSINQCQSTSFFPVDINGVKKFMHKQTANWYFAKTKPIVSSDRLKRVQNKH